MLSKLTIIFAAIFVLTSSAISQQPCSKALNEAPAINGLRLEMTFDELQPLLGQKKKTKPPKTGEGSFFLDFNELPPPDNLKGIKAAYIRFVSSKVYQIEIFYDDKDRATKLEDFTTQLSSDLNLPAASWKTKNGIARIDCGSFLLTADVILNRHVELTDNAALVAFKEKKRQEKESKKRQ